MSIRKNSSKKNKKSRANQRGTIRSIRPKTTSTDQMLFSEFITQEELDNIINFKMKWAILDLITNEGHRIHRLKEGKIEILDTYDISDVEFEVNNGAPYGLGLEVILDGEEWWFLTEKERDRAIDEAIGDYWDNNGMLVFSGNREEYVLENNLKPKWFREAIREMKTSYIEDIEQSPSSDDRFENRLQEEMSSIADTKEEFLDYMMEEDVGDDPVGYYKSHFGLGQLRDVAKKHNLYDKEKMVSYLKSLGDAEQYLSNYDDNEYSKGYKNDTIYWYRLN